MDIQEAWKKAYDLHYKSKNEDNKNEALILYREISSQHPYSEEGKYSLCQIENLRKSNPELFNEDSNTSAANPITLITDKSICTTCHSTISGYNEDGMCAACFVQYLNENIIMTTTNNIDGFKVTKYIDIKSVEIIMGTGFISETFSDIADIFGARSVLFEGKLADAKRIATEQLRYAAYKIGGNAVIGIDLDYTEFSSNRVGVIISGTIVKIIPITNI
ncbi:YbjQ family protein [Geobacter sulfurreducens]|uniref:YbjQ family protein n=1 Tax=Geobacter sulfurreducens TaxID=35554 RepID=UPI0001E3428D|nr:heavy metal-binding domain-containing protein [Geobacter sulfurreducens]ADN78316.1 DUF74 domain protein [Geobacter sulfurreducens KN400]